MNGRALPIRALVVGPPLAIGGTERHLARVLPALSARGFDVHLHVTGRGGPLEAPILAAGVPIEGPPAGLSRPARVAATLRGLVRRIRGLRPDLVHLFLPEPALIGSAAARLSRPRPRVLVSRRSLALYRERYPAIGALERLATRGADALLGNSSAVAEELVAECGDPTKVAIIRNGVPLPEPAGPQARAERRARLGVSPDALLVAVVANLIPYKGHADLLAALALAAPRLPTGWRLALVGRDDGVGAALDAAAARAGIADAVLRTGSRADAAELLGAADVAVLPSHEEGFSNALIEGLAAGVPTVATAVGGNLDAIEDGESGLLVPVRDPPALAAAILRLVEDPAFAARLGRAGRARAEALFGEEAMLARYERLWRWAAERGSSPIRAALGDGPVASPSGAAAFP